MQGLLFQQQYKLSLFLCTATIDMSDIYPKYMKMLFSFYEKNRVREEFEIFVDNNR